MESASLLSCVFLMNLPRILSSDSVRYHLIDTRSILQLAPSQRSNPLTLRETSTLLLHLLVPPTLGILEQANRIDQVTIYCFR